MGGGGRQGRGGEGRGGDGRGVPGETVPTQLLLGVEDGEGHEAEGTGRGELSGPSGGGGGVGLVAALLQALGTKGEIQRAREPPGEGRGRGGEERGGEGRREGIG